MAKKKATRLKIWRDRAKLTQEQMSKEAGIPLRTYQRLEAGDLWNPPIRYLINCAIAHAVPLNEICEDEWLDWTEFVAGYRHPNTGPETS